MPTRFTVSLLTDAAIQWRPHQLHAIVSGWLDDPADGDAATASVSRHGERGRIGSWSVSPLLQAGPGRHSIEVNILDDRLISRLARAVDATAAAPVVFGGNDALRARTDPTGNRRTGLFE